jgi:hypothetical protein
VTLKGGKREGGRKWKGEGGSLKERTSAIEGCWFWEEKEDGRDGERRERRKGESDDGRASQQPEREGKERDARPAVGDTLAVASCYEY